jgi:hypothetical protein
MRDEQPIKGAQRLRTAGAAIGSKNAFYGKEQLNLTTAARRPAVRAQSIAALTTLLLFLQGYFLC